MKHSDFDKGYHLEEWEFTLPSSNPCGCMSEELGRFLFDLLLTNPLALDVIRYEDGVSGGIVFAPSLLAQEYDSFVTGTLDVGCVGGPRRALAFRGPR